MYSTTQPRQSLLSRVGLPVSPRGLRSQVAASHQTAMHSIPPSIARRTATIRTAAVLVTLCGCTRHAPTAIQEASVSLLSHGNGTAALSWEPPKRNLDGSAIGNLAGYFIYYGKSPTNLNIIIKIPDPYLTTYTVDRLGPGTYYFRIVAFTENGIHSSASPTVSKTIR